MLGWRGLRHASNLKQRMAELLPETRERLTRLRKEHGKKVVDHITIGQTIGGMRGVKALICETSKVDPHAGIRFRGYTINECRKRIPSFGNEPSAEGMFWLLLTGEIPSYKEANDFRDELYKRSVLPKHTKELMNSLPKEMHPMTQLSIGVLSLQTESEFDKAYEKGIHKTKYWEPTLEDALNLVAQIPRIAAIIYRNKYKDRVLHRTDTCLDWSGNFAKTMGFDDPRFWDLMRIYMCFHSDHEGGNVSAHSSILVSSALSDAYKSYSAALNGLAGPLHGLANQESLDFYLQMHEKLGKDPSDEEVEKYVKGLLASGRVIPGYGHAVLRVVDPRFTVHYEFGKETMTDDPLFRLADQCSRLIPRILKEQGKAANPYPNIDSITGTLLHHYGLQEHEFFTVLFGVSRAIGCMATLVWSRALGLPIERPDSVTIDYLKDLAKINKV